MSDAIGDPGRVRLLDLGHTVADGTSAIERAARLLRAGENVAIPTDTVYGLAAALNRPLALAGIMRIKGRPDGKSLPILLADGEDVRSVRGPLPRGGSFERLLRLAGQYWPGPLTIALPAAPHLAPLVVAADGTVGVRVPDDPTARAVLTATGGALAVTSANRSGQPTPATADGIAAALGPHGLRWVLDGGPRRGGTPSTVIGVADATVVVHRAGALPVADLLAAWDATDPDGSRRDD